MNRKLLQTSLGVKWNPFSPDVPVEALWVPPRIALFCSRLEFQAREGGFALMRLVGVTSGFTTPERREDVERFFTDHPVPGAERSVRQSLERISLNVAWLDKNRAELTNWFVG